MKSIATTAAAPAPAVIGSNSLITAYNPFRLQIAEMKEANAAKKFNYEDPDDNKAARSHVHRMRGMKGDINRVHDEEKKEILETGRRIDAQRNELIAEVDAMIDVHAKPLQEIEERAQKRLEDIKAQFERMAVLSAKGNLNAPASPGPLTVAGAGGRPAVIEGLYTTDVLKENLATLEAIPLDATTFGDSLPEAAAAKSNAIIVLRSHIADAEKREAEAAELERLRAAQAERDRIANEERIRAEARKEAEDRAAREAEELRQAAANREAEIARKAEEERAAAAQREAELRTQAETAERQRRAAEETAARDREEAHQRAEEERREAAEREANIARDTEERLKREAEEAATAERQATEAREADKKHRGKINAAAVAALVEGGMPAAAATKAITLIAQGKVPGVSVAY